MKEQKKLTLGMAIFTFIIFVSFGVIILNEKSAPYFAPKIEKKLIDYLKTEYKDEYNDFDIGTTIYSKTKYNLKVTAKKNKNLYFNIFYDNKKITDTYEKDYKQGKTLLNSITKKIKDELKNKYNQDFNIIMSKSLDEYSKQIQDNLILKNDLKSLKIYTLETTITSKWNTNDIGSKIIKLNNNLKEENLTPKSYNITIINSKDATKSVKISNLTTEIIEDSTLLSSIISDIIKNENSELLKQNNITYKYFN